MRHFFALLLICLPALAAAATGPSLDYHCLALCMSERGNSQACLQQCTYGLAPVAGASSAFTPTGHNQFTAPLPDDDTPPTPKQPAKIADRREDYQCLRQCEQTNAQLGLCQEECHISGGVKITSRISIPPTYNPAR